MTKPYIAVPVNNNSKKKSSGKKHTNTKIHTAVPVPTIEEVIPISAYKNCMAMAGQCQGEIIDLQEKLKKYEKETDSNRRCGIFGCGAGTKKPRKTRKGKKARKTRKTRKSRKARKTKRKNNKRIGRKH